MRIEDLRLGFVGDRCACVDDGIWVDAGVGRLIEALAARFRHVTVALAASPRREPLQDMRLSMAVEDYVPLPWLTTIARGFHRTWSCRSVIREVERRSDVLIVQLPFAAPLALLKPRRPRLYHLCADILDMARKSNAYGGYRRVPALAVGHLFDRIHQGLLDAPGARVVTNGEVLLEHYGRPPGRAVVSTTILDREIMSVARRRPKDAPFRVLYVGYLRLAKGIDTLFAAFDQVLDRIPDAELVIVGAPLVVDDGMNGVLRAGLSQLSRKGTVRQVGHVNFGPELFQHYADADVLALPSRSEGTPRVLVEARAFGCPVIATRVGGIPTSVTDGIDGMLVAADDATALRDSILRVARDREFREQLVVGGLRRARESTVESFAGAMVAEIEQLVAEVPAAC